MKRFIMIMGLAFLMIGGSSVQAKTDSSAPTISGVKDLVLEKGQDKNLSRSSII